MHLLHSHVGLLEGAGEWIGDGRQAAEWGGSAPSSWIRPCTSARPASLVAETQRVSL
jgi:hypothetical protein